MVIFLYFQNKKTHVKYIRMNFVSKIKFDQYRTSNGDGSLGEVGDISQCRNRFVADADDEDGDTR